MAHTPDESKPHDLSQELKDVKLRPSRSPVKQEPGTQTSSRELRSGASSAFPDSKSSSHTPRAPSSMTNSPRPKIEESVVGGDIEVVQEPGEPPKLSRTMSKKILTRPPPLFTDWPDATQEAQQSYDVLTTCTYGNKYLGTTDHAMECECNEEWDATTKTNHACGDDSDCINRATKMECTGDCCCGSLCQNQRFQRRQYAKVSVIQTEKKGYGLRADVELPANSFIFEYIGEVIGDSAFRRRLVDYDKEGIKHFYFMSLNKGEFVDATKKGNKGRFCNHSCNPNCYVDKWVIGDKLRMGIFAERRIKAGEELVFNYNVDRYGANPQPCYCGEPNCTGFIGGKTQTERATKLSAATIEALGIDDGDSWDLAVAKKTRKKKSGEDDEEYVDRVEPKSLDEDGVVKVMATLMQCKEKWIAVKLLSRLQQCEEERIRARVVKMHGYQILKSQLSTWIEDRNVILQILYILHRLPRITRNKIQDSGIEAVIAKLLDNGDETVRDEAQSITKIWSQLEVAYRIPRQKRDPNATPLIEKEQPRRRSRSRSRSRSPPKVPFAPTGPRAGVGRGGFGPPRAPFRRQFGPPPNALPPGWFMANADGRMYFYSASGETSWVRPTAPAVQPPPPPPKVAPKTQALDDIIKSVTAAAKETPKPATPIPSQTEPSKPSNHDREKPEEKWRSLPIEKQKRIYECTLHPTIKNMMDKYRGKLDKQDLKRFAGQVSKTMVASDYKKNRVDDPTKISDRHKEVVKKFTRDFFDRAVAKGKERAVRKAAERVAKDTAADGGLIDSIEARQVGSNQADEDVVLSDMEDDEDKAEDSPASTQDDRGDLELKRKREADNTPLTMISDEDQAGTPLKRARSDVEMLQTPPPPPPPPPLPVDTPTLDSRIVDESPYLSGANGTPMQGSRFGGRAVGLGINPGPPAGSPPDHMQLDEVDDADDEDFLVDHWGMSENTDQRLPMRQSS